LTSPGPELKQGRHTFGCTLTKQKIYIGGGEAFDIDTAVASKLASTEFLDLSMPNPTWSNGPDFPAKMYSLSMVESSNGILALGGRDENGVPLNSIFKLSCDGGDDCEWTKEGELNVARAEFNVIPYTSSSVRMSVTLLQPILLLISFLALSAKMY